MYLTSCVQIHCHKGLPKHVIISGSTTWDVSQDHAIVWNGKKCCITCLLPYYFALSHHCNLGWHTVSSMSAKKLKLANFRLKYFKNSTDLKPKPKYFDCLCTFPTNNWTGECQG